MKPSNTAAECLFFERAASFSKGHPYCFWTAVACACFCITLACYHLNGSFVFLCAGVPIAIGTLLVPWGVRLGYRIVRNWEPNLRAFVSVPEKTQATEWFNLELIHLRGSRIVIGLGFLAAVFAVMSFEFGGAFEGLSIIYALLLAAIVAFGGFISFIGIFSTFWLSRMVWRLGRFKLNVENDPFGVPSIGGLLGKCYFIAAFIWCFFSSSAALGLKTGWIPMAMLAVPSLAFFIGSFIVCQIPVHNRMVEYKRAEVSKLSDLLQELKPQRPEDLTEERRQRIEFYSAQKAALISLPEWPFSWKSAFGVGLSGVLSVLPTLFEIGSKLFPATP